MDITIPHTITLGHPVQHGKDLVEELVIERRMIAGDLTGIPAANQTIDHLMLVGGRICGQPSAVMKKMDLEDAAEVVKLVSEFMAPFREIGSE